MLVCPSCNTQSIQLLEKLACTRAKPINCPNCRATLSVPSVSVWAMIAGLFVATLLFPLISGAAFVHGAGAVFWGYFAIGSVVTAFAAFAKLSLPFDP